MAITKKDSLKIYESLYLCRKCEEFIIKHYPEDQMRTPMHMSLGQEFISVGVSEGLKGNADIFCSYRSHSSFLAQTKNPEKFFAELFGRVDGTAFGKSGSMHLSMPSQGHILSSGVVATQIPVALGTAFANKQLNSDRIVVVYFGDGATDAGVFWESLNISNLYNLPILFICEDNDYAVDSPRSNRQSFPSILESVKSFGIKTYFDDSGEVESIFKLVQEASSFSKSKNKSSFLLIKCCRYLEHVGIGTDWHWGYRSEDKVTKEWINNDALIVQRKKLKDLGYPESEIIRLENDIDKRIISAINLAKESSLPDKKLLYEGVFL